MKKLMIALTMMLLTAATGKAMSYEQARNEALFLTDKMAYELNLTDEQYEAAYEINLDYLMGIASRDDVFGAYWEHRNLDLSYILLDWQWEAFRAAAYFYRPLYWSDGFWHFAVYARYPHRDYFFFGRPVFYATYRGGHAWHIVGGQGYYHGHRDHFRPAHASGRSHFGMLDRWNRGDFNHGRHQNSRPGIGNGMHHGGPRSSSTQSTVNRPSHHNDAGRPTNRPTDRPTNRPTNRPTDSPTTSGNRPSRSTHSAMSESRTTRPEHITTQRPTQMERVNQSAAGVGGSFGRSHSSGSFSRGGGSSAHSSGSFSRGGGSSSHGSGSFSRGGGSSAGRSGGSVHNSGGRR